MKRKLPPLYICFYILAVVFLIIGVIAVIACHQNISSQIAQGVPVAGYEFVILDLYLQSGGPYLAFAALMFLGGDMYRYFHPKDIKAIETKKDKKTKISSKKDVVLQSSEELDEEDDLEGWTVV